MRTLAGSGVKGTADGGAKESQFNRPYDLALSADGQVLYVADGGNGRLRAIMLQGDDKERPTAADVGTIAGAAATMEARRWVGPARGWNKQQRTISIAEVEALTDRRRVLLSRRTCTSRACRIRPRCHWTQTAARRVQHPWPSWRRWRKGARCCDIELLECVRLSRAAGMRARKPQVYVAVRDGHSVCSVTVPQGDITAVAGMLLAGATACPCFVSACSHRTVSVGSSCL